LRCGGGAIIINVSKGKRKREIKMMKSESVWNEGVEIFFEKRDNGKIYRVTYTKGGAFFGESYVYGVNKVPYVRSLGFKMNITGEEMELLKQVA
jgi:hypothetical protein